MATKSRKKVYVRLQCTVCKRFNYITHKSAKATAEDKKLELKKFCLSVCKKHTIHKEVKR